MSAGKICEKPCETCKKEGLPLLLTRYAVFPKEAEMPALSGNLNDAALSTIPLGDHAQYGLRLLRSGYVYVFDEARKNDIITEGWSEYFVTSDSFFTKLSPRKYGGRTNPATEFACARNGYAPLAGVITIEKPKHAKAVWIGFSDVEWTDDTLNKHNDASYRDRHMTKIIITDGKVNPQPRTAPIEQVETRVPEFNLLNDNDGATTRRIREKINPWTPFPFNSRRFQTKQLSWLTKTQSFTDAIKAAYPQGGGAIVALMDPVGMAEEIAAMMEWRKVVFMSDEDVAKPKFAASVIASQEVAIKTRAKLDMLYKQEEAKDPWQAPEHWDPVSKRLLPEPDSHKRILLERAEARLEALEDAAKRPSLSPPGQAKPSQEKRDALYLELAAEEAWRKYTRLGNGKPRMDVAASEAWLKQHDKEFKQFDLDHIAPLAKGHAAWMQHTCMADHMTCNYDENDKASGVAYTNIVIKLLRHTTDKQPGYDLYRSWLNAGGFDNKNLLMRAMAFNQKELIAHAEKAAKDSIVDGRILPVASVTDALSIFMGKMPEAAKERLGILIGSLSGPILKHLHDLEAGNGSAGTLKAIKALTGGQYMRVTITGDQGQLITEIVEHIYELNPSLKKSSYKRQKLRGAVRKDIEKGKIPTTGAGGKLTLDILIDEDAVKLAGAQKLTGEARNAQLLKTFSEFENVKKISLNNYYAKMRQVISSAGESARAQPS